MHYLVTGGAGFIGNTLALKLIDLGHKVSILDVVNDYYDVSLKEARLKRLPDSVAKHRVDLNDIDALDTLFSHNIFDGICHLAAQAGVRYSLEHPEVYVQTNYVGTFNLLEQAKKHKIKKFVFASTSSVYGTSTEMPFVESDVATVPMSIYAATKRACEHLCATYSHLYKMDIACLRFFTVYGPWGRPDMALFIFTDKILKGETITVYNNGNMMRDFTYVDDIVSGFTLALEKNRDFNIFNLGNGSPVRLMDFIKSIELAVGKTALIDYQPLQPGDVPETSANITKAAQYLGYCPVTSTETGVQFFVDWYKTYYKA